MGVVFLFLAPVECSKPAGPYPTLAGLFLLPHPLTVAHLSLDPRATVRGFPPVLTWPAYVWICTAGDHHHHAFELLCSRSRV